MERLVLYRYFEDANETYGILMSGIGWIADTLELPWRNNEPKVSCIPEGLYPMVPYFSAHNGKCFKILEVPGRSDIEMHVGNSYNDTEGCILAGIKLAKAVASSRVKIDFLLSFIGDGAATLEIKKLR